MADTIMFKMISTAMKITVSTVAKLPIRRRRFFKILDNMVFSSY